MFGVVNVGVLHSDRMVKSYGKDSMTAPTEVGRANEPLNDLNRTSIQSAQSKFGWNFRANENISGVLELDMVNFDKSTPSTHELRVRKASFQYQRSDSSRIRIGKDFMIFNGVGPHTSNWVGGNYRAGNTGFILDEMVYFRPLGAWELALSLGNFGRNFGETNNPIAGTYSDLSFPSYTVRLENKGEWGHWGLAYMGSIGLRSDLAVSGQPRVEAWAAKVYFDLNFWQANWRFSVYQGVNAADLALLGLAHAKQGTNEFNVEEEGAFLSVQHQLTEKQALYGGVSAARIKNPTVGVVANTLSKNQVLRLGYKQELEKGLHGFVEFSEFSSDYVATTGTTQVNTYKAFLGHAGFLYTF